jgi:serine/threonine protein kinase/Tfp pilus assembly protein PilF
MAEPVVSVIADRYTLIRELGRGGMGAVWLAQDRQHDRPVAIKLLHSELAGVIGGDRFLREVRVTAQLQHPNIVPMLDSGVIRQGDRAELPWYAMPYIEGESLRARLNREPQLAVEEALRITDLVAQALVAAHQRGVVHRDIKPENILLSGGSVYVVDFGIAKALAETDAARLTSTGLAIGTPAYMSPEQATADRVDARTDQYSLATVLYEMLVGEPPFAGRTAQAIVARRLSEAARPIHAVRPGVPPGVEAAVLRALQRAPADRFVDLAAFNSALHNQTPVSIQAPRPGPPSRPMLIVLAALMLLVTAGYALLLKRSSHSRPRDPALVSLYNRGVQAYDRRTQTGIAEAAATFNAILAKDSSYADAWAALAKTYARADLRGFSIPGVPRDSLIAAGVRAADRALAIDSTTAAAWLVRGVLSERIDPTDDTPSLRSIRRSLALDSTRAETWHHLAMGLANTGDLDGAIATWHKAVTLDPSYTLAVGILAQAYYWRRQYDSAAVWADSVVALDPSYLLGRTELGYVKVEQGDLARAGAAFDAAAKLSSGVEAVNVLAGIAFTEARAGQMNKARSTLVRAESLAAGYKPLSDHTALFLAQAHAALGDRARAIQILSDYRPRGDLHFQLHLRCDPPLDLLSSDPAFRSLLLRERPRAPQGC